MRATVYPREFMIRPDGSELPAPRCTLELESYDETAGIVNYKGKLPDEVQVGDILVIEN